MSLEAIKNCTKCGRIYIHPIRKVCHECYKEIDREFQMVYHFIREKDNRQSTIYEVSNGTGVSVAQITEFIREGRISVADYPNLGYPCESCGENMIVSGNICDECRIRLANEIKMSFADEERRQREYDERNRRTYFKEK